MRICREAVGDNFNLCIDVHRSMTVTEAIVFAKGVGQYYPYFIEDPITKNVLFDAAKPSGQKPEVIK